MKALILNSGIGKRMGELSRTKNKCMVEIADGVPIIDWQLSVLDKVGIRDVVLTTGPFAEALKAHVAACFPKFHFSFCHNPEYDRTNYIYSIALAEALLRDDEILLMHGDLVFEERVLADMAGSQGSVMAVDMSLPLPEKDFKAVVKDNKIVRVGIDFFDDAYAAQPLYRLTKGDWNIWLDKMLSFCACGDRSVYAENALNEVSRQIRLSPFNLAGRLCTEVDNQEDLVRVRQMMERMVVGVR